MFLKTISERVGFEVVSARGIVFSAGIFLASVSGMVIFPLYYLLTCHVLFLHTAYNLLSKKQRTNDTHCRSPFTS